MDINLLENILQRCWCKETSSEEDWTPENPARGQDKITALLVQDYFGGVIAKALVKFNGKYESHYFNNVGDGEEIDLTACQYSKKINKKKWFPINRVHVLDRDSVQRYQLLKEKVKIWESAITGL